jgi:hypothetical protein|tara:strand:- start:114 stop:512 length:399 start_codon:yes stop_codon:yes gene_type:complete
MKKILSTLVIFTFLVGCADVGNKSIKDVDSKQVEATLTQGVTTKAEVEAIFGDPYETSFTDGGQVIYKYQYDDASYFTPETVGSVVLTLGLAGVKSKGKRNELTILFDENDIVKKFNMSNSDIESGSILFAN